MLALPPTKTTISGPTAAVKHVWAIEPHIVHVAFLIAEFESLIFCTGFFISYMEFLLFIMDFSHLYRDSLNLIWNSFDVTLNSLHYIWMFTGLFRWNPYIPCGVPDI